MQLYMSLVRRLARMTWSYATTHGSCEASGQVLEKYAHPNNGVVGIIGTIGMELMFLMALSAHRAKTMNIN